MRSALGRHQACQGHDEVGARVLAQYLLVQGRHLRLLQEARHVCHDEFAHLRVVVPPQGPHQVHGRAAGAVPVGALEVPAQELLGLLREELEVLPAKLHVGQHHGLAKRPERGRVLERRGLPLRRGHGGQQAHGRGGEVGARVGHRQAPRGLDARLYVRLEVLVVAAGVQGQVAADLHSQRLQGADVGPGAARAGRGGARAQERQRATQVGLPVLAEEGRERGHVQVEEHPRRGRQQLQVLPQRVGRRGAAQDVIARLGPDLEVRGPELLRAAARLSDELAAPADGPVAQEDRVRDLHRRGGRRQRRGGPEGLHELVHQGRPVRREVDRH
mmetsp:Transcript_88377/g.250227  ORF Transcript_88377/g.250227 Transcript_88377/m.250227 type:complete len:330 (-) Transcript_88377:295-1284(-)